MIAAEMFALAMPCGIGSINITRIAYAEADTF